MSTAFEAARQQAGMSVAELWVGQLAIGGMMSPSQLEAILAGTLVADDHDHDALAQALNDRLTDLGVDDRVTYSDDLES